MDTGVSVLSALKKEMQGWIRTAAEPTAACGGNREARLGQRSAFSKPCQGAAEKAASATRKTRRIVRRVKKPLCNSDDRCQRQKQGGAVGAAASRMRVPPKARCSRWEPRPGLLFCAARAIHPRPPRTPVSEPGTGVSVLSAMQKGCKGRFEQYRFILSPHTDIASAPDL